MRALLTICAWLMLPGLNMLARNWSPSRAGTARALALRRVSISAIACSLLRR
ncbi:hypothetical protein D3C78_1528270 [compost metagenome]